MPSARWRSRLIRGATRWKVKTLGTKLYAEIRGLTTDGGRLVARAGDPWRGAAHRRAGAKRDSFAVSRFFNGLQPGKFRTLRRDRFAELGSSRRGPRSRALSDGAERDSVRVSRLFNGLQPGKFPRRFVAGNSPNPGPPDLRHATEKAEARFLPTFPPNRVRTGPAPLGPGEA